MSRFQSCYCSLPSKVVLRIIRHCRGRMQRLFTTVSWSHLLELCRLNDPLKRAFYELEAVKSNWSFREMKRQINNMLYERIGLSKDKAAVLMLAEQGQLIDSPQTLIRDPYILEFLGLAEHPIYNETDL